MAENFSIAGGYNSGFWTTFRGGKVTFLMLETGYEQKLHLFYFLKFKFFYFYFCESALFRMIAITANANNLLFACVFWNAFNEYFYVLAQIFHFFQFWIFVLHENKKLLLESVFAKKTLSANSRIVQSA